MGYDIDKFSPSSGKGGVVGSESRVLIVPPNSSILYRITNLANTLSTATFEIDWIEVDV